MDSFYDFLFSLTMVVIAIHLVIVFNRTMIAVKVHKAVLEVREFNQLCINDISVTAMVLEAIFYSDPSTHQRVMAFLDEEADKIKHLISHPVYTKNPPNGLFDQNDLRHTHRDACFLLQKSKAFKEMAASYENHCLS